MNPSLKRLATIISITALGVLALSSSAQAAFSMAPTRTFAIGSLYALSNDGTFFQASGGVSTGTVVHYDDEGNNLGDGFNFTHPGSLIIGVGAYNNRVYMTDSSGSSRLISYQAVSPDPNHDPLYSDPETNERIGGNQAMLRVLSDGTILLGLGQENKVGILNGNDLSKTHPFYPQAFHGAGINKAASEFNPPMNFESCVVGTGPPAGGEPQKCGNHNGYSGANGPLGFSYPNDIAPSPSGFYVSENFGNRITHVNTVSQPGGRPDFHFGIGPGSGAGQLTSPQSIVRQPNSGNLFVSEDGNRRISVFDPFGGFIAAFGYGVLTGADTLEVCGIDLGPCRAGVPYQSDSRSYFSRLDFGADGELYAYMPVVGRVQVFAVSGGEPPVVPGGGSGSGGGGSGSTPTPGAPVKPGGVEKDKVRLAASPLKVEKGKKTTLTAKVSPTATCGKRLVLFQTKDARSLFQAKNARPWENIGKPAKPGKACTASKRAKVTTKSVFRAVLIDAAAKHPTLGYSPNVTVNLK